jgi:hypothetical protein
MPRPRWGIFEWEWLSGYAHRRVFFPTDTEEGR